MMRNAMQRATRRTGLSRLFLGGAAAMLFAGPALASGCGKGFPTIDQVEGLRVFAVVADKPYANPGDSVDFEMSYYDGLVDPNDPDASPRPVQILWLGGCVNPPGDEYYGCYPQLAELFKDIGEGKPPPPDLVSGGIGVNKFSIKVPDDIVSSRPKPPTGPHYGLAYVFFAACAGEIKPVPPEGNGAAGDFPLGCFDAEGKRLGAESFVPGYTQVYVFEDGRPNANPEVMALTLDGEPISEDFAEIPEVERCGLSEDERSLGVGCDRQDPYTVCTSYKIDVDVPSEVGEFDPDSKTLDGKQLREVVWVDYFVDRGSLDTPVTLVSDVERGELDDHEAQWIAPSEPGLVNVWAVVHDGRGGAAALHRMLRVK